MPGGFLKVEITSNEHIFMTGEATKIFEGKLNIEDLIRLLLKTLVSKG